MSDPQTLEAAPSREEGSLARAAWASAFAASVGLAAFLLFSVQPLLGKRLLPWFGGTSALWTTCLMFFQLALVTGYAWAHGLARRLPTRRQRDLHLLLLALALAQLLRQVASWSSPLLPPDAQRPSPSEDPIAAVLRLLATAVGLPFLVLAATSPLLSAWFARRLPQVSPFGLFALSNLGSLVGLVSYPLLVEPNASLPTQAWLWSGAFVLFALGVGACAVSAARGPGGPSCPAARVGEPTAQAGLPDSRPPGWASHALWLALAAFPSLLLLAVTSHLTQEVAAVPMLWTLPLALYLLTFVGCFGWPALAGRRWAPTLALGAALAVFSLQRALTLTVPQRVLLWSLVLLTYAMAGHGELVRRRPASAWLTGYYLTVAAGGASGGVLGALVAPRVFDGYWELHAALLAGPLTLAVAWAGEALRRDGRLDRVAASRLAIGTAAGVVLLAVLLAADVATTASRAVVAGRTFYGVLRVTRENQGTPDEQLKLLHGRIAHGLQLTDTGRRREPTTYFGPTSGVGLALERQPRRLAGLPLRVGIVGLGAGTLAAWSRPGDVFRFYELDPAVAALSRGAPPVFSYLQDAFGEVSVALGDGRLELEREPAQELDVLVLDAFSSDAIPTHLLTREAFSIYERHLRAGGVIAVQVTNRYLDLKPVVRAAAASLGAAAVHVPSYEQGTLWSSDWMLVTRERWLLEDEVISAASLPPLGGSPPVAWTDDWSGLWPVLKR